MKVKILGGIAVLAIATIAAWNMNLDSKTNGMSNVMLTNVEALAEENTNCPGNHCSFTNDLGTCSSCCPLGKNAVCNAFGCGCD